MVKRVYNLTCTDDLTSLIKNMEYYNEQINETVRKEVDLNLNKYGMDDAVDSNIDVQLACLNACLATYEWVNDCIVNYRILIQKANMGIMPTANKENLYADKSESGQTTKQVSTQTERSTSTSADDIPF